MLNNPTLPMPVRQQTEMKHAQLQMELQQAQMAAALIQAGNAAAMSAMNMNTMNNMNNMNAMNGIERRAMANATLGYVTQDACPGAGDDTLHAPLPFYGSPDFIASNPPNVTDETPIDLVFVDFIEDQLLGVLNTVQSARNYTEADVQSYTPILANAVLGLYAQKVWN